MKHKTTLMMASLSEQIYDTLVERLIRLEIKPGERIIVDTLREEFSVSIAPIREALQRLTQENLVVIKPRIGFFANTHSISDVESLFEARRILESYAITDIINTIEEEKLISIRNKMLQISKESKVDTYFKEPANCENFENMDVAFHSCVLIDNCKNSYIKTFYKSLSNLSAIIRHITIRYDDDYKEHIAIIDAMLEKDINKSIDALGQHFKNAEEATINSLRKNSYFSDN